MTRFKAMRRHVLETPRIKSADISMLNELQDVKLFSDKIAVFDSLEGLGLEGLYSMQGVVLLLVEKGSCELEVNLNRVVLSERCVFMMFTDQVARVVSMSHDFKPLCVACSRDAVEEFMTHVEDSFRILLAAKQTPCIQWEPEKFEQVKQTYELLRLKIQTASENKYYYIIIRNVLLALAAECVGAIMEHMAEIKSSSRKDTLFNAFILNVEKHHKQEHSVKFYADELFVTPKYLSAVIDELSGKGAKQWIDEYIALDAKVLLRSTKKDVQEISDELNFPDMSFFGKFFKRMVGESPKAYRMKRD